MTGGWVTTAPEPEVKLCLRAQSYHHAWHAEVWHDRLPELHEALRAGAVAPANDAVAAFLEALAVPHGTIERLTGVHRVLTPHLIAAYGYHLERASPVSDGPTVRWLRFVLQDEVEDWRAGERLLQSLIRTPAEADRAAGHQARLARLLVAAGGIAGPGTVPGPATQARGQGQEAAGEHER